MPEASDRLNEIARQLRRGERPSAETVRTVLSWFGAQRRSTWMVSRIRIALKNAGLETVPDVWSTYLDGNLRFVLRDDSFNKPSETPPVENSTQPTVSVVPSDPTYRL